MARTSEGATLTRQHRQAQLALRAATLRDLQRLWPIVSASALSSSFGEFAEAAFPLIASRYADSAGVAAAYYRELRRVEYGAGSPRIVIPERIGRDEVIGTLHTTGLTGIYNGVRAGFSPQAALQNGLVRTMGSTGRLVLNGGRAALLETAREDRRATGYRRVTSGDACDFCSMLASRRGKWLYNSERTADFKAHDHCSCTVEPDFT